MPSCRNLPLHRRAQLYCRRWLALHRRSQVIDAGSEGIICIHLLGAQRHILELGGVSQRQVVAKVGLRGARGGVNEEGRGCQRRLGVVGRGSRKVISRLGQQQERLAARLLLYRFAGKQRHATQLHASSAAGKLHARSMRLGCKHAL